MNYGFVDDWRPERQAGRLPEQEPGGMAGRLRDDSLLPAFQLLPG
jgi:hypothetical protein